MIKVNKQKENGHRTKRSVLGCLIYTKKLKNNYYKKKLANTMSTACSNTELVHYMNTNCNKNCTFFK